MIEQLIIHQIGLSSEIYLRLIELCKMVYVRKNGFLLRQGKVCSFIGIVKSGVLRSYISKEGEEHNSDFYFEDSFVTSYRSFLTQEKSVGSIQALEDSFIYCLDKSDYDRLLNESTEWYKLGKYIADTLFINKCRKETAMLTDDAYNRYKLLLKTYPNIEQHVSQYHIASYLGIRAESLSRIKSLNIGQ